MEATFTRGEIRSHQYIIDHDYDVEWNNVDSILNFDPEDPVPESVIFESVMGEFFDGLYIKTLMEALEPFDMPASR